MENDHLLLMRFAGLVSGVAQQTSDAVALIDNKNKSCETPLKIASDDASIWCSLATLPLRFADELTWRVGLRPADVEAFLAKLVVQDDFRTSDRSAGLMWHAGLGEGQVRVVDSFEQTEDKTISRLEALRTQAQKLGSALIIESAPAGLRNRIGAWGPFGASGDLSQRIKQQLDPDGILSQEDFLLVRLVAETCEIESDITSV